MYTMSGYDDVFRNIIVAGYTAKSVNGIPSKTSALWCIGRGKLTASPTASIPVSISCTRCVSALRGNGSMKRKRSYNKSTGSLRRFRSGSSGGIADDTEVARLSLDTPFATQLILPTYVGRPLPTVDTELGRPVPTIPAGAGSGTMSPVAPFFSRPGDCASSPAALTL
ncbi:hypothetical protein GGR53DRAFT_308799 [Hypoxylon sp. FL1150]|nr:hypothetical protein GGR53DRAFT_308799 [Hypoxylon sp. FL1150]